MLTYCSLRDFGKNGGEESAVHERDGEPRQDDDEGRELPDEDGS